MMCIYEGQNWGGEEGVCPQTNRADPDKTASEEAV